MANEAIKQEVADKLFDQVKGIVETGSGGEIKILRSRDEAEAARQQMIDEVKRRIQSDPLVLELARLEMECRIAEAKEKAAQAQAPAPEVAPEVAPEATPEA